MHMQAPHVSLTVLVPGTIYIVQSTCRHRTQSRTAVQKFSKLVLVQMHARVTPESPGRQGGMSVLSTWVYDGCYIVPPPQSSSTAVELPGASDDAPPPTVTSRAAVRRTKSAVVLQKVHRGRMARRVLTQQLFAADVRRYDDWCIATGRPASTALCANNICIEEPAGDDELRPPVTPPASPLEKRPRMEDDEHEKFGVLNLDAQPLLELGAATTKIQALQRGKAARKALAKELFAKEAQEFNNWCARLSARQCEAAEALLREPGDMNTQDKYDPLGVITRTPTPLVGIATKTGREHSNLLLTRLLALGCIAGSIALGVLLWYLDATPQQLSDLILGPRRGPAVGGQPGESCWMAGSRMFGYAYEDEAFGEAWP